MKARGCAARFGLPMVPIIPFKFIILRLSFCYLKLYISIPVRCDSRALRALVTSFQTRMEPRSNTPGPWAWSRFRNEVYENLKLIEILNNSCICTRILWCGDAWPDAWWLQSWKLKFGWCAVGHVNVDVEPCFSLNVWTLGTWTLNSINPLVVATSTGFNPTRWNALYTILSIIWKPHRHWCIERLTSWVERWKYLILITTASPSHCATGCVVSSSSNESSRVGVPWTYLLESHNFVH